MTNELEAARRWRLVLGQDAGESLTLGGADAAIDAALDALYGAGPDTRSGGLGLLRDLHDLYLLASYLDMAWMLVGQAAKGARDEELIHAVAHCANETEAQQKWLTTRLKAAAPQALLVAD